MINWESIVNINWYRITTKHYFNMKCVICDTSNNVEMHHLRKVNDVRQKYKNKFFYVNIIIICYIVIDYYYMS